MPFLFAGPAPDTAHAIGALANQILAANPGILDVFRHLDARLLNRSLGGTTPDHGELLSFLLFDSRFTAAAAELGAEHARRTMPGATERGRTAWPTTIDDLLTHLCEPELVHTV